MIKNNFKTILVVEDDENIRDCLTLILSLEFSVIEAVNGKKALEALENLSSLSLIVLDLMMPQMDGYTFLKYLAELEKWKRVPVIIASSSISGPIQNSQVKAMLKKPVDMEILLDVVRRYAL